MGCWIKSFALSLLALGSFLGLLLGDLLGLLLGHFLSLGGSSDRRGSLQCLSHGPGLGRLLLLLEASRGSGDGLVDGGGPSLLVLAEDLLSILEGCSHSACSLCHYL